MEEAPAGVAAPAGGPFGEQGDYIDRAGAAEARAKAAADAAVRRAAASVDAEGRPVSPPAAMAVLAPHFRAVMLGAAGTGKTALLRRHQEHSRGRPSDVAEREALAVQPTVAANTSAITFFKPAPPLSAATAAPPEALCTVQLWDLSGDARYRELCTRYLAGPVAAYLLVYDASTPERRAETLAELADHWVPAIAAACPFERLRTGATLIVLIGAKYDYSAVAEADAAAAAYLEGCAEATSRRKARVDGARAAVEAAFARAAPGAEGADAAAARPVHVVLAAECSARDGASVAALWSALARLLAAAPNALRIPPPVSDACIDPTSVDAAYRLSGLSLSPACSIA